MVGTGLEETRQHRAGAGAGGGLGTAGQGKCACKSVG